MKYPNNLTQIRAFLILFERALICVVENER